MSEPDFKCGTFSSGAIPPEIRARMDADRRAAENRHGEPEAIELERVLSQLRRREVIGSELLATLLLPKNRQHIPQRLIEIAEHFKERWDKP